MMVKHAADAMDTVDTVRVSHGAFRPVAFSPSIAETTVYEYGSELPGRVVFEDGEFIQVPPFARERVIELPEPYGTHPQWIIPHSETRTVHEYLKHKGVRLIEVRGTWPPKNMQLIRALYDWGFFRNETVRAGGAEFGIMEAVAAYLLQAPEGTATDLYGYALHVEVTGACGGRQMHSTLTHTHPPFRRLGPGVGRAAGLYALRGHSAGRGRFPHGARPCVWYRRGHPGVRIRTGPCIPGIGKEGHFHSRKPLP